MTDDDSWYDTRADSLGSYNDGIAELRVRREREWAAASIYVAQLLFEFRRILKAEPEHRWVEARRLLKRIESEASL